MENKKAIYAADLISSLRDDPLINGANFKRVVQHINDAPAVDAVVHGEWIMCLDIDDCEFIECPLCGSQFYDGDNDTFDRTYNYCPNCGAKMDGGNEGE
jgi:predicted nucleic acid-binding Zn ribbon protein